MTVKERVLSIRLSKKINRKPEYARRIGLSEKLKRTNWISGKETVE